MEILSVQNQFQNHQLLAAGKSEGEFYFSLKIRKFEKLRKFGFTVIFGNFSNLLEIICSGFRKIY